MTPQRCLLPSILSRVTASVQAALQNVTKVPLTLHLDPREPPHRVRGAPGESTPKGADCNKYPGRTVSSFRNAWRRPRSTPSSPPPPRARPIMLERWRAGMRLSEALALEARDPAPGFGPPHPGIQAGQGTKGPGGPGPSGTADGLDRGHKFRDRRPGEADWGVPGDGLEVGAAGGPPGHRGWPNPPESCRWNSHVESQFARNMLLNGIPLNFLSWWFGRGQIQTTAPPANNTSHQARSPKWSFS